MPSRCDCSADAVAGSKLVQAVCLVLHMQSAYQSTAALLPGRVTGLYSILTPAFIVVDRRALQHLQFVGVVVDCES